MGTKYKVTIAMVNKAMSTHITCVHIYAKFELATAKTVACSTVYRSMS